MKYQLVLQFEAHSKADYDDLIAAEEQLSSKLELANIDGHDFGSGTFNIFMLTDEPRSAFQQAHAIVLERRISHPLRAGYRGAADDGYIVLWPPSLQNFSVL